MSKSMMKRLKIQRAQIEVEGFSGEKYSASTARQIVAAMRETTFGGEKSDGIKGYMQQVAKRVFDWSGKNVRTDTPENFLSDLHKAGQIRLSNAKGLGDGE